MPSCARPGDGQELGSSKVNKATVPLGAKTNPLEVRNMYCMPRALCAPAFKKLIVKSLTD